MPLYIHPANLIIPKRIITTKYNGGLKQFRREYLNLDQPLNQEDDELVSICRLNPEEFDIEELITRGISFDHQKVVSDDFVIVTRYKGMLWRADWLQTNNIFCWHESCNIETIQKANDCSNLTMDQVQNMMNSGTNPFITITSRI